MVRSFQEALLRIDHHGAPKGPIFDLKMAENYTNPVVMSLLIRRLMEASLEKPRFFQCLSHSQKLSKK
jgi:hypothetical protein